MTSKLDIPLNGTALNIVRRCGPPLSDVLQSKFGCVATIDGVDFDRDLHAVQQKRPTFVKERRFTTSLPCGVQVSVWKADLADFKVDAVVNAANERLQHDGGLAQALSNAGGPQIQKQSDDYIAKNGPLKTGNAIVLDPGSLSCKKIIHAVGPYLSVNPFQSEFVRAEQLLENVIRSILDEVEKSNLQSVAIPAISSGIFNYPLAPCANTIVVTVKRYYDRRRSPGHLPKEILFVNNDDPTVRAMETACLRILGNSKSGGDAKTSAASVQLGNVCLTLMKGNIEEQLTDVIVNTTSWDRDLSVGQISKALLDRAGQGMQHEIRKATPKERVIVTKAYNLQCKEVFHTFCPEKRRDSAREVLFKSVSDCLLIAANKHKSIAFPAIGTGHLGFSKKESAEIMSQAVSNFAQKAAAKMDVYFVIFPSDDNTFKAFKEQMEHLRKSASHPSFQQAVDLMRDDLHGSRAPTPQISLHGPSDEATREAERWLSSLLFRSPGLVFICNNFIQHFGEQEHLQLSRLVQGGLSIEEFFENGRAGLLVSGESIEDVVVAGLQTEAILCSIQREFVLEEEYTMLQATSSKDLSYERKMVEITSPEIKDIFSRFKKERLRILKVDRVENPALQTLFDLKKKQLRCNIPPQEMIQRIPAHFCEMVSRIGFHAEYAPPDDTAYGEGIYFAAKLGTALELWKVQKDEQDEYLYFVTAAVLTGNSTRGRAGLILPPAVGADPHIMYDSVSGPDISVIFSGYQALPRYIITCKKD